MPSLQDITPEQANALNKQSRDAYNAEVQSRQALLNQHPQLKPAFNQQVHPQSLCGCGCQQKYLRLLQLPGLWLRMWLRATCGDRANFRAACQYWSQCPIKRYIGAFCRPGHRHWLRR